MKKPLLQVVLFLFYFLLQEVSAQTVLMPTSGSSSITTCGGTFYDSGNSFNFYSFNESGTLTVCPSTPGRFLQISFSDFALSDEIDYLFIYDGNSTNAPLLAGFTGYTLPAAVKASTSNTTGCLTFKFISQSWGSDEGWTGTFSCSTTGSTPKVYDSRDCYKATFICTNSSFAGNSTGTGINDLTPSWIPCATTGEKQSSWYYFRMATGGTLGLTITPDPSVDYDFAIWGPYNALKCPANTMDTPIRCSYASTPGDTGLGNGAFDDSEDSGGDKWVSRMNVSAGDFYVMNINNFSADNTPFSLNWNLQNGASFNCSPLPIELVAFKGKAYTTYNDLFWQTSFEENNNYFEIERSENGIDFNVIDKVYSAGNSYSVQQYGYTDHNLPSSKGYYYRLRQTDFDGHSTWSSILFLKAEVGLEIVNVYPNPAEDVLSVLLSSKGDEEVMIEVIDARGKTVFQQQKQLLNGLNPLSIDVIQFVKGIYYIKVHTLSRTDHVEKSFVK